MEVVSIDASPNQLSRLRNGHKVRVRRGGVHGCGLVVHPHRIAVMKRNFDKGKAIDVQLSPEELEANRHAVHTGAIGGGGIFAGGKINMRPIQNLLKVAKKTGDTLGKPFEKTVQINPFTLGYDLGHDVIAPELMKVKGGRVGKNLLKTLAPRAEAVALGVAKHEAKKAISGGGKSLMRKIGRKQIRSVSKHIGKIAKEVVRDVILPEGKAALKEEIQRARQRGDHHDGHIPMAEVVAHDIDGKGLYAGGHGLYAGARGGAIGPQVGSSLLKMDNPALRSQPYSANFAMNAQLPPQYVRGGVRFV
jgi:hypothetical protein